ncbi:MAG: glycosyl transferase family 1 [Syntrophus sp. (in: bacteria)]|nr:glycosyl transferase family 1 [Syntrophus sp. (in: bacteria)]
MTQNTKENSRRRMRIAIVGSRGIPGNYGGFETFAERLGLGLIELGQEVTVYCPAGSSTTDEREYHGIRRILIPNIPLKSFDKISSSLLSCFHAALSGCDIILLLGVAPAILAWLPRLTGKKLVVNIDGLEWKRKKWGKFASRYLKLSERLAVLFCHRTIADSEVIRRYVQNEYSKDSVYIAYGADPGVFEDEAVLERYGLKKHGYFLQVCRLEPENNSDIVIREYMQLKTEMPLVIVGDAPYSDNYKLALREMADERVKFLGAVFGENYNVLRSNSFCYIHAHEVGGTNPSLLEALAAGNCVVALDVTYNLEVIKDAGLSFSKEPGSLLAVFERLLTDPQLIRELRLRATERIREHYTWDKVISQYEGLFAQLLE